MSSSSFSFKTGDVDRFSASVLGEVEKQRASLLKKMNAITTIVYNTAHTKRPQISAAEHKALGKRKGAGNRRVSNPSEEYGVPVQTGTLQISIKKSVTDNGKSVVGEVYVDPASPAAQYANYMEVGTSKIRARPFMRPALELNKALIKFTFEKKS